MNQTNPLVLDIDKEIDNTLAETHKKLAALSETATRMNSIITESKISRTRTKPRSKSWVKIALGVLVVSLIIINITMAIYISRINDEYKNHIVMSTAQQQYFIKQIQCIVDAQHRPTHTLNSDCAQYTTDTR